MGLVHTTLPGPLPVPLNSSVVCSTTSPSSVSGLNVSAPLLRNQKGMRWLPTAASAKPNCGSLQPSFTCQPPDVSEGIRLFPSRRDHTPLGLAVSLQSFFKSQTTSAARAG